MLLIFAILFAPYIFAEEITASLPQAQDAMASYVATIDTLRLSLDRTIAALSATISGFTSDAAEPAVQN